jgi:acetyltransferase-like isoleucine patch superfamily enzyme
MNKNMNFDPNFLVGILFQTHQQFTLTQPFVQHPIKNLEKINENEEQIKNIIKSFQQKEQFETFSKKCLEDLNKLNLPYGTAHYGYQFWVNVAIVSIYKEEASIPNGCCSTENCSINILYDIVCDNLINQIS